MTQHENDLAELLIEIAQALDNNQATINDILDKLECVTKKLEDVLVRIEKLEKNAKNEESELIKKQIAPAPAWPLPAVPPPPCPFPLPYTPDPWKTAGNKCVTCGINFGNGYAGYFCSRTDCPNKGYAYTTTTFGKLSNRDSNTTTCACGKNSTCQCNKNEL